MWVCGCGVWVGTCAWAEYRVASMTAIVKANL